MIVSRVAVGVGGAPLLTWPTVFEGERAAAGTGGEGLARAAEELAALESGAADTGTKWLLALETHSHKPSYRGLILMASAGMVVITTCCICALDQSEVQ